MTRTRAPITVLLLALVLAGCGDAAPAGDDEGVATGTAGSPTTTTILPATTDPPAPGPDPGFPVTVTSGGFSTTIATRPTAIVSLSPTATEMLFAVGAGAQVVAVDEFSYYPEAAPVTDLSGFAPNLEAIVSYTPDLVVLQDDQDGIVEALAGVGVPALVLPPAAVVEDAYEQVRIVGVTTGHVDEAETVASDMEERISALVAGTEPADPPLTYYHELGSDGGGGFYSVTSATFIGAVFGSFGLENIADPADEDGFGYPVLSVEHIIEADPDLVFYTDCCGDTPDSFAARPGWETITAIENGAVHELDDDLSSRWGPRLVRFFEVVASALAGGEG